MRRPILFSAVLAAILASCDEQVLFEENKAIDGGTWGARDAVTFEFDVDDTVRLHNFYVNIRNGEEYPYSNLFLFVEMEFPNGKKSVDTLDCPLADPQGKWLGSGIGKLYDQRILYRSRVRFPLTGHYRVDIRQAMREDPVAGIYDAGFRVELAY